MAERRELVARPGSRDEAPETAPRDVLEEHALDGVVRAEAEDLVPLRLDERCGHGAGTLETVPHELGRRRTRRVPRMPIHLRAEPGDYADACLLPGDPLRAKYIAETFLDDVTQVNEERGLLGYTGHLGREARLGAGNGHGLPGRDDRLRGAHPARRDAAAARRDVRRPPGRPRARRPHRRDLRRAGRLDGDAPRRRRAALPDCELGARPRGRPRREALGQTLRVGPIVSSDLFYNPDEGQYERWSKRGVLAVEMEAAALFTLAALRGVHGGCLLTVSDIVVEGEFVRISDDELRAAVDRMTRIALDTATAGHDGH